MRLFKKILAGLMAAALMCSAAPAALAASDSEQEDLLDILHQLYLEQAESEQETISFPALYDAVAASEDDTDTTDETEAEESSETTPANYVEVTVEATAEITFGEPAVDEEKGTVTVDVYVTALNGVNGVQAYVTYGDLTFDSDSTTVNDTDFTVADVRAASADNTLLLTFANADNMTADKLLLTTLTFTYEDAAAGSDVTLYSDTIYVAYFGGYNEDTNTYTTNLYEINTEGTATVAIPAPEYTLGDVNEDGKINSDDAILILQYIVSLKSESDLTLQAGDVNNDGKVNSDDAVLILQYVVGLVDENFEAISNA
ncbi:MAG: dockerin type I repeat-containing protein [Oscillospiraceae bacterium]|nr:dockerin type I repeat-containing protein [Oscillospiraceae bacterium]